MLEILIVMRDVLVAVVLSWMGFSEQPDSGDKKESVAPSTSISLLQ
ncbi:MAG: hypothetical protein QNI84_05890 [Henriciella sp.]|nr:hypothetical protein [Henriciella sp.]